MIETTTRFFTSHQIFLKEAKGNATNQINKTDRLEAIEQPKRAS